ncbi:MAG TPA: hypothetical protein VGQ59_06865, partial [Cyclobacteriaceae bacterium]|nr:hypothetical protein [Cyclobacteriaceae bacterium]
EEAVHVKSVNRSVEADFQARLVGDRFTISMNNKVSQYILDTLRKSVDPNSHLSRSMDRVSKSDPYFQKLVEDRKKVLQCMDMIQLRRKQQYKLVSYLVEYQKEFLLDPEKTPKPLLMKEVAEKFGMSESSISRLASRKAIEIDGTVLSIRTFFSLGVRTDDGNRLSYEEMNKAVNSLINSEEVAQNDSDLAKGLKEAGINVSENQVKNIREQFGIPDRNERQEINSSRQQSLGF